MRGWMVAVALLIATAPTSGAQSRSRSTSVVGQGGKAAPATARPAFTGLPRGTAPGTARPSFGVPGSSPGSRQGLGPQCARHGLGCGFGPGSSPLGYGAFGPFYGYAGGYGYPAVDGTVPLQAPVQEQDRADAEAYEDALREERLRQVQADADTPASPFSPRSTPSRSAIPPQESEPAPVTVLVFRDGSRVDVQNYAVTGKVLYEFGPQWTKKIALSDLDLGATTKANDERGVEFRVPSGIAAHHP